MEKENPYLKQLELYSLCFDLSTESLDNVVSYDEIITKQHAELWEYDELTKTITFEDGKVYQMSSSGLWRRRDASQNSPADILEDSSGIGEAN